MTREQIFEQMKATMVETFELDPAKITTEARLVDDLGLDSIDAIDLAVKLQELTGERVAEETLKSLRTVSDVITVVDGIVNRSRAGA
jgi:acyl carrier protein